MIYYTHAGLIHLDEVLGWVVVKLARVCDSYKRLTDLNDLPADGILADIGRKYDPAGRRFDHHQGHYYRENGFKLATAGMLWKYYGPRVVHLILDRTLDLARIAEEVDRRFFVPVDAYDADNSYNEAVTIENGVITPVTLPTIARVYNFDDVQNHYQQDGRFYEIGNICEALLRSFVKASAARIDFENYIEGVGVGAGQEVFILTEFLPWRETIIERYPDIKFVIQRSAHPGNAYSLCAVRKQIGARELRVPIARPSWFNGFIHQDQFIAGANSMELLQRLALFSIAEASKTAPDENVTR